MDRAEELIEYVRKYSLLYDPANKEYRNKTAREEAWEEIAQKLETTGNVCKETWIKLRNAYTNAMKRRKPKTGQGTKRLVKWKYEDQMDFLALTLEPKTFHGTSEAAEDDASEGEEMAQDISPMQLAASLAEDLSPPPPSLCSSSRTEFLVPKTEGRKRRAGGSMDELVATMIEGAKAQNLTNEMDLFFLSLSKTVQRLSPEEQVRLKMEVGQMVFQAEFRELQSLKERNKKANSL